MSPAVRAIATLGGIGHAYAPGTVASIAALPLAWLVLHYGGPIGLFGAAGAAAALGTWACDRYVRAVSQTDPSECVVDELAGQWLTCVFAPPSLSGFVVAFVLFRLFDIVKPWPVSWSEGLPEGAGVMADDLVAGVMAGVLIAISGMLGLV